METIKNYLENMFMNLPKSKKVLQAKEELLTMMEDKYTELKANGKTENEAIGIVISEFGNLEDLAEEFGIREYLDNSSQAENKRLVTLEEAKQFIATSIRCGFKIGIGVMLCICSPIVLILLHGVAEQNAIALTENAADAIGLIVLLLMVAGAVSLFIMNGLKLEAYDFMKKEVFRLEFATDAYVREQKENFAPSFAYSITIGVILCILSIIPVTITGLAFEGNELLEYASVGLLLLIVSIAVFLFINAGTRFDSYKLLLQEDGYEEKEKENKLVNTIASIYWPLVTCGYLAWSFITMDWGTTWIIWPIAGILFGAISTICNAIQNNKEDRI